MRFANDSRKLNLEKKIHDKFFFQSNLIKVKKIFWWIKCKHVRINRNVFRMEKLKIIFFFVQIQYNSMSYE